ncbi:MAG TPA: AI-2E family transporter [Pelomicrobium sp.]|nr:AI-2E family transporter [Pelomicrobium sp.]
MDRAILRALLTYTALLGVAGVLWLLLAPVLPALSWAAVIAVATFPLYARLRRRLPWRDTWTALAMTAFTFLVLLVPAGLVSMVLVRDVVRATEYLQRFSAADYQTTVEALLQQPWIAWLVDRARQLVDTLNLDVSRTTTVETRRIVTFLFGSLTSIFGRAASAALQFPVMVIAIFFLYRDGERLADTLWRALPLPDEQRRAFRRRMEDTISAVVIGILGTAVLQGLLAGVGYWFVALPSAVLLGALTAVASLVPVVGTVVIWLPAVLYLLATGATADGLILLGWCAAVVGGSDNFLRPLLTSGRTGLPFSLRMLGLFAGLAAFGLIGLVLGPLILAACVLSLDFYRRGTSVRVIVEPAEATPPTASDRPLPR